MIGKTLLQLHQFFHFTSILTQPESGILQGAWSPADKQGRFAIQFSF